MLNKYGIAPRLKGIADFDDSKLEPFRDTKALTTEAVTSGNALAFFPSKAEGSEADANYIRNPLPRTRAYDIVGVGIGFTHSVLNVKPSEQSTLDLPAFIADLFQARMVFETGQQDELLDLHMAEVCAVEEIKYALEPSSATGTGDGFTRTLSFPDSVMMRLPDPLHLEPQESWTLDLEFASTSNFLAEADWANISKAVPGVIATLAVAFRE
ncbi:gp46 [Salisaeta icosahedral phage 1]|uniref:gp46 n=1 Tax=Salisaeta icosahedral phage 1 TaxID=1183239 RepID=UPI00025EA93B|nr:gp46 [Salisaeta icosahedral phage 1]AFJ21501.1 gp46 [Salisaeta icosahedral phage 1]